MQGKKKRISLMVVLATALLGVTLGDTNIAKADSLVAAVRHWSDGNQFGVDETMNRTPVYQFKGTYSNMKVVRHGTFKKYATERDGQLYVYRTVLVKSHGKKDKIYDELSTDPAGEHLIGYYRYGHPEKGYASELMQDSYLKNNQFYGGKWWLNRSVETRYNEFPGGKYSTSVDNGYQAIPDQLQHTFKNGKSYIRFSKNGWQTNLKQFENHGVSAQKATHVQYKYSGYVYQNSKAGKKYTAYITTFLDNQITVKNQSNLNKDSMVKINHNGARLTPTIFYLKDNKGHKQVVIGLRTRLDKQHYRFFYTKRPKGAPLTRTFNKHNLFIKASYRTYSIHALKTIWK